MVVKVIGSPVVVLAVVLLAVIPGCSGDDAADTAPPPRQDRAVPNLVGLRPGDAVTRLCAAGLSVGTVTVVARTAEVRQPGLAHAASRVRGTTPGAGAPVPEGATVDLRLAIPRNAAIVFRNACEPID